MFYLFQVLKIAVKLSYFFFPPTATKFPLLLDEEQYQNIIDPSPCLIDEIVFISSKIFPFLCQIFTSLCPKCSFFVSSLHDTLFQKFFILFCIFLYFFTKVWTSEFQLSCNMTGFVKVYDQKLTMLTILSNVTAHFSSISFQ